MKNAAPQSKSNQILEKINGLLLSSESYLSADDFTFRLLKKNITELIQATPIEGWELMAILHSLSGDAEEMRNAFDNVRKLGGNSVKQIETERMLDFFSRAAVILKEIATPESGHFRGFIPSFYYCGAFRSLDQRLKEARTMGIELSPETHFDSINTVTLEHILSGLPKALRIMDRGSISEDDISAMLDIAGEMIRTKKWLAVPQKIHFYGTDEQAPESMHLIFNVPCNMEEAVDLDFEFADKLVRSFDKIPEDIYVTFRSEFKNASHA